MSAYVLTWDHIGFLVNLGQQLDICSVNIGDNYQSLALYDEHDRSYVAAELMAQCRTSVAWGQPPDIIAPCAHPYEI